MAEFKSKVKEQGGKHDVFLNILGKIEGFHDELDRSVSQLAGLAGSASLAS